MEESLMPVVKAESGLIVRGCPACRATVTVVRSPARTLCCKTCLLDTGGRIELTPVKEQKQCPHST
jgi:hypothetical protein